MRLERVVISFDHHQQLLKQSMNVIAFDLAIINSSSLVSRASNEIGRRRDGHDCPNCGRLGEMEWVSRFQSIHPLSEFRESARSHV